jgi:hypothetical protein
MPATGSKKIDTVAAERVRRKRRAASMSNSLRRISVSSGIPPWEAFVGEVLGLLG